MPNSIENVYCIKNIKQCSEIDPSQPTMPNNIENVYCIKNIKQCSEIDPSQPTTMPNNIENEGVP
jgi:hypothetical protein